MKKIILAISCLALTGCVRVYVEKCPATSECPSCPSGIHDYRLMPNLEVPRIPNDQNWIPADIEKWSPHDTGTDLLNRNRK